MHSNLLMYLTAMSAVSIHNIVNNINEVTKKGEIFNMKTQDTNWTLEDKQALLSLFPLCNGTSQSPINIISKKAKENINLRLGLTAYDKPVAGFIRNQFPTFRLVPLGFRSPKPSALVSTTLGRIFNPYADSHFTLDHIQFHWPSLHKIDNESFPIEIHFVHLNTAYSSLNEALQKPDGLLIFAVMGVQSSHESYIFNRLLDELSNVTLHEQQVVIEEDSTWRSLLPADTSKLYRYYGSMTMPPCHESVQWIVFEERLKLGHRQLKRLKKYRFKSRDKRQDVEVDWASHERDIQPLNARVIERSFIYRS